MSAHERRPARRASLHWRLSVACPETLQRSDTPSHFLGRIPHFDASAPEPFSTTKIIAVVSTRTSADDGLATPGQLPHQMSMSTSRQGSPTVSDRLRYRRTRDDASRLMQ